MAIENDQIKKLERLSLKANRNIELDQNIKTNQLVARHYGILKNLHTRQYQRDREADQKKISLQEKHERAQARKEKLLQDKVEKAAFLSKVREIQVEAKPTLDEKIQAAQDRKEKIIMEKIEKA